MTLQRINEQLDQLYRTNEAWGTMSIATWYRLEGDAMNFQFTLEDDKYARITTNRNFSEYIAWSTGDWKKAKDVIEKLASIYAVSWDPVNGALFIRFRRNEMTLAQAIMRLQQAVFVIGSLGSF